MHVVTVNDYLARRDSEWVGQVHRFLGLSVGLVQQGLTVRGGYKHDGVLSQQMHSDKSVCIAMMCDSKQQHVRCVVAAV